MTHLSSYQVFVKYIINSKYNLLWRTQAFISFYERKTNTSITFPPKVYYQAYLNALNLQQFTCLSVCFCKSFIYLNVMSTNMMIVN